MFKGSSVVIKQNDYANVKKFLAISLSAIMIFGSFSVGFLAGDNSAFGAKPTSAGKNNKNVIEWSNGAPSGAHHNLIIHGKKLDFNCDNSPGGGSVFVPTYTKDLPSNPQEIEFVTNKKSQVEDLTATDPCSNHFDGDPVQVQIPFEESGYYVYWSLKGKPQHGKDSIGNVSNFTLAGPNITQFCNVTEAGSVVLVGDSDVGSALLNFLDNIRHEDTTSNGIFDIGETVYDDVDLSQDVSDADVRLANAATQGFLDGDVVGGADSDKTLALVVFVNGIELYRDTTPGGYSIGEPIYDETNGSIPNEVDPGDVRLFVKDFSEALDCEDIDLINGAGAITDKEAFKLKNGSLERFDSDSPPKKGKNKFIDITGLFLWSGAICNATILGDVTINTIDDGQITIEDFAPDGVIEPADLVPTFFANDAAALAAIEIAESDAVTIGNQDLATPPQDDGLINTDKEFAAFMEVVFGGPPYNCTAIYDVWVFNLAQIVAVGVEVINDGGITVQVRFYPVDTTVV